MTGTLNLSSFDHLNAEERKQRKNSFESARNRLEVSYSVKDIKLLIMALKNPEKWKDVPVSLDTFLDSPVYLGIGSMVYPRVREMAREILEGGYAEAVIVAGIGSGKSFLSEILACYKAHWLLCMRNPHTVYELSSDKPIAILNMGTTARQANDVVFSGIRSFVESSPWFMSMNPRVLQSSILFQKDKILMLSGNSKSTTPLGYNVYCGILDEAAFYLDTDQKNVAEEIYTSMRRRIISRFGYDGLLTAISSPRYVDDFVMQKLEESEEYPYRVYGNILPTWKSKPLAIADQKNKFYFNNRKGLVIAEEPTDYGKVCYLEDEFDPQKEIWEIPGEYRKDFEQNPDMAKRDYAAVPTLTLQGFFPHPEIVRECFDDNEPSPVQDDGSYDLPPALRTAYYIHIDLALNKEGKGDACGLGMAHFDGWEDSPDGEKRKKVKVDLLERITAGPKGYIEFEEIRRKIYAIKAKGYFIKLITFDGFQSVDISQILKAKGYKVDYLSPAREMEPWNSIKELVYDSRVKCHKMPKAVEELCRLEVYKDKKVDHPPGGSADVAEAFCGCVYNVLLHTGSGSLGVLVSGGADAKTEKGKQQQAKDASLKRLEFLRDMNAKGVFL